LAVIILAALLESTVLHRMRIQDVLPDLTLLLVVYFALQDGEERAMFTGVLGGIMKDVAGNARLGHNVLALVIVGYLAGRLSKRLVTDHPAVKAGLVFVASLTYGVIFVTVQYVQEPSIGATYQILTNRVPTAFYTALVTPVVFLLLDKMFRRSESLERSVA
jgi:rod shape-determining protein MreD